MNDNTNHDAERPLPMNDERVSAYLDGELSADELDRFEAQLREDPAYEAAIAELRQVSQSVQSLPKVSVSDAFAEQVMQRVSESQTSKGGDSVTVASNSKVASSSKDASRSPTAFGWRPLVYAALTLAAAILFMLLSPSSWRGDRANEIAMSSGHAQQAEMDMGVGSEEFQRQSATEQDLKQDWDFAEKASSSHSTPGESSVATSAAAPPTPMAQPAPVQMYESTPDRLAEQARDSEASKLEFESGLTRQKRTRASIQPQVLEEMDRDLDRKAVNDTSLADLDLPASSSGSFAHSELQLGREANTQHLYFLNEGLLGQTLGRRSQARSIEKAAEQVEAKSERPPADRVAVVALPRETRLDAFFAQARSNGLRLRSPEVRKERVLNEQRYDDREGAISESGYAGGAMFDDGDSTGDSQRYGYSRRADLAKTLKTSDGDGYVQVLRLPAIVTKEVDEPTIRGRVAARKKIKQQKAPAFSRVDSNEALNTVPQSETMPRSDESGVATATVPSDVRLRELQDEEATALDDETTGHLAGQYVLVEASPKVITRLIASFTAKDDDSSRGLDSVTWYSRAGRDQLYSFQRHSPLDSIDSADSVIDLDFGVSSDKQKRKLGFVAPSSDSVAAVEQAGPEPAEREGLEAKQNVGGAAEGVSAGKDVAKNESAPRTVRVLFYLPASE